ncbi:MAG TPA: hypothetical protein VHM25_11265 [Polyangiaceae bacterium]|jgi:hypothetical protein|nr:hypothetical protein [Polyangiaceae bacterium]
MMFASQSLAEHLARGLIGLGALLAALFLAPHQPWLAVAALPIGLFALRGCPSCWLLGLAQTLALGRAKAGACVDGSCANRPSPKH